MGSSDIYRGSIGATIYYRDPFLSFVLFASKRKMNAYELWVEKIQIWRAPHG